MPQITIRGIDPEIEREIRRRAKENHKSINQVVKEIIHKQFSPSQTPASSLRQLSGGWTEEQAAEFESAIYSCEQIDEEMWR
jgi:plasmid stability protein